MLSTTGDMRTEWPSTHLHFLNFDNNTETRTAQTVSPYMHFLNTDSKTKTETDNTDSPYMHFLNTDSKTKTETDNTDCPYLHFLNTASKTKTETDNTDSPYLHFQKKRTPHLPTSGWHQRSSQAESESTCNAVQGSTMVNRMASEVFPS
eukprot:gene6734-biopygen1926